MIKLELHQADDGTDVFYQKVIFGTVKILYDMIIMVYIQCMLIIRGRCCTDADLCLSFGSHFH